jgi:O-antigen biosynthesis protein
MLQFTGERFIPSKELLSDEIAFEHLHRYHSIIPFIKHKTVLDIACGEGYGTNLIGKYAHKVYGVDLDQSCIKWATEKYAPANNNLEFKTGSVDHIPVANNSIDVVVSFETIEHVNSDIQQLFMAEVKRVLKPNGILIISTPNTANYSNRYEHHNEFHLKEFQKEEFHAFLKSHFRHSYHFEQGYEIVSTISGEDIGTIKELPVYNWERELKKANRKYLISIAGNEEIKESDRLSSIVMQVDKDYLGLIDYIVSLQKQEKDQQQAIQQLGETVQHLQETIQKKDQKNKQLSIALTDTENIILDQNYKITTLQQQIDQLNGRLSEIYSSDGWRLLSVYYRFKGKLIPEGSGRHKKLKKLINTLRNKKGDKFVISDEFTPPPQYITEEITHFDIIEFPQYDQPKVSIIIPAYDGWQMNYKCLRSIFRNTQGVSYEVIFADDGASDETTNIKDYIKNIVAIRNENNLGFLKNCNHAASFAKGEYILFLNNDTEVTPGWLYSLTDLMDKDPKVGIVGSKLVYPNGRLQEAGGIIWQDNTAWNYGHKQNPDAPEFNYVKEVDYISGASIMIRKSAWEKLGGFDDIYSPAYCEDADLAFEVRKLGLKVVYQPLSVVIHHEGFSHGTDNHPKAGITQIKAYQKLNIAKFSKKWKDVIKTHSPNAVDLYWARDRSKNKKTILVIDHYVPQFDKDAGSRTTFQYLQLFTQLGMNVKFIGDNFYKHEPYTTALLQLGIEVLYGPYHAQNWQKWIVDNEKYFDYILLNRPHITSKYIDFLRNNTKTKLYYYGHDLHFHRELMEYELTKDKAKLTSSKTWKKIEYDIYKKSDVVLTPTLKEKEIIQADFANKKIEVMPAFFYPEIAAPVINFNERKDLMFVGGFTHTPNVDAVLWFIEKVLPVVQEQTPGIKLIVVGSNVPESVQQKAAPDIIIKGYVSDQELQQLYNTVKMVVIPLRYGAGLKGKTVEAMVNGLPFVSTSFGLEGLSNIESWLKPHDNEQDFAAEIISLYNDQQALRVMSSNMVDYSGKNFTSESAAIFFKKLFSL